MIFETSRLGVRDFTAADFPEIYRIQSDPEVMRYIRAPVTEEQIVRDRMAAWADYAQKNPGLGVWGIFVKDTGVFAGYVTCRHTDFDPATGEYEVGYVIVPEHWGQGYATEVTQRACEYVFEAFSPKEIIAFTDPLNVASQRVLLKCGFENAGFRDVYGGSTVFTKTH
jgi:ribosomal-protein-alanine N-acetyltransferase